MKRNYYSVVILINLFFVQYMAFVKYNRKNMQSQ